MQILNSKYKHVNSKNNSIIPARQKVLKQMYNKQLLFSNYILP